MEQIPETDEATVLRTDFSDDAVWRAICAAIREPVGGFQAYVTFVEDRQCEGITVDQVRALATEDPDRTFMFIVDSTTVSSPEHPILVLDLHTETGGTFRVIPSEMWGVENNLSIANMDFADFASSVDSDRVFRGFPGSAAKTSTSRRLRPSSTRFVWSRRPIWQHRDRRAFHPDPEERVHSAIAGAISS